VSTGPSESPAALRACWHPVAYAADVARAPCATLLLGEPLVLWRELVCAYHGWRYRGDGACTAIPQLAEPTRVPARARAVAYPAQERYGIMWAALEPPPRSLPEVPELDDPAWRAVRE